MRVMDLCVASGVDFKSPLISVDLVVWAVDNPLIFGREIVHFKGKVVVLRVYLFPL
jgi:hypothetical protein